MIGVNYFCRSWLPHRKMLPNIQSFLVDAHGSIPACAGEPYYLAHELHMPVFYPRVCGGTGVSRP